MNAKGAAQPSPAPSARHPVARAQPSKTSFRGLQPGFEDFEPVAQDKAFQSNCPFASCSTSRPSPQDGASPSSQRTGHPRHKHPEN